MKILLVGHSASPIRGSEPGFTWNWAWYLARVHQVTVIACPVYRSEVDAALISEPNPNLQFIWVDASRTLDPWRDRTKRFGIRIHYVLWLRAAMRRARELLLGGDFDLIHHVSWGTIIPAPPLGKLPVPFLWGPVGGCMIAPPRFLRYFGAGAFLELLRNVRVKCLKAWLPLRRTASRASIIFATNRETLSFLGKLGASECQLFLDGGISPEALPPNPPPRSANGPVTVIWAGQHLARKGLPILIDALKLIRNIRLRVLIVGDGRMRKTWQKLSANVLADQHDVSFLGSIPWVEMANLFRSADIFAFTSLRDSFGTVVLEAMAQALPIVTLNHQGVGAFVPDNAGIKVSVTRPVQTVEKFAEAIQRLANCAELRQEMGTNGWKFAETQTWDKRAESMTEFYKLALPVLDVRPHPSQP